MLSAGFIIGKSIQTIGMQGNQDLVSYSGKMQQRTVNENERIPANSAVSGERLPMRQPFLLSGFMQPAAYILPKEIRVLHPSGMEYVIFIISGNSVALFRYTEYWLLICWKNKRYLLIDTICRVEEDILSKIRICNEVNKDESDS